MAVQSKDSQFAPWQTNAKIIHVCVLEVLQSKGNTFESSQNEIKKLQSILHFVANVTFSVTSYKVN